MGGRKGRVERRVDMRKVSAAKVASANGNDVIRWGAAGLALLAIGAVATAVRAEDQKIIISHGISTFGTLKYPADLTHLDYVNPDAPKGGEMAQWAFGTFDSLNRLSVKGNAAGSGATPFETILVGTADEIGSAYCLMCETMEYPEDRSWVIFNLRRDVKFSDGSPMTAEDVKFSYDIGSTKGIAEFRTVFAQQFQSVEVLDPYRVKFTFAPGIPYRDLPTTAGSLSIFSKADYIAKNRDLEESSLDPLLATGPYVLGSMEVGRQIVWKRNPDYWGNAHPMNIGQNNFDSIRIEYFADSDAAFEGFKAGLYTFRNENSSKQWATGYGFDAIEKGYAIKAEIPNGNMASGQAFLFNMRKDKFKDPKVREAIALMFNFEWSNKTLFYDLYARIDSIWDNTQMAAVGPASPAEAVLLQPLVDEGLLPAAILTEPALMAPTSDPESQLTRANLRAASDLLDEAGWAVDPKDGIRRNAAGEVLTVEFLEASPSFERVINPYVENLKALGIDAKLTMVDPAQLSDRVDPPKFDFDIINGNAVNSYEPGSEMEQSYASKTADNSTRNRAGVSSPAVDRLIEVVKAAKTREELDVATQALDRVLRSIRFWVPQWYKDKYTVAYYDVFGRPDAPPTYALGETSLWWYDTEKAAKLKAAGVLK
jgi:microcin C transport system substrate-binding protein